MNPIITNFAMHTKAETTLFVLYVYLQLHVTLLKVRA